MRPALKTCQRAWSDGYAGGGNVDVAGRARQADDAEGAQGPSGLTSFRQAWHWHFKVPSSPTVTLRVAKIATVFVIAATDNDTRTDMTRPCWRTGG